MMSGDAYVSEPLFQGCCGKQSNALWDAWKQLTAREHVHTDDLASQGTADKQENYRFVSKSDSTGVCVKSRGARVFERHVVSRSVVTPACRRTRVSWGVAEARNVAEMWF